MPTGEHKRATLGLAVIVRDEAADLARLLAHHAPLVDAAVVVDTGSRDGSDEVAAAAGAELVRFPWCDDFSAARNAGLAALRTDRALVLDCDELIAPADFAAVRAAADEPGRAWVLTQRNYCTRHNGAGWTPVDPGCPWTPPHADGYEDVLTCRLFPVDRAIRYEGVVHEVPDATIARAGCGFSRLSVVIHHRGHLLTGEKREAKNSRYTNLLRRKVRLDPRNPKVRHELALQLVAEGRPEVAARLLERTVREFPLHLEVHPSLLLLARLRAASGHHAEAADLACHAMTRWPDLREGWLQAGRHLADAGRTAEARRVVAEGARLFPADPALRGLAERVNESPSQESGRP